METVQMNPSAPAPMPGEKLFDLGFIDKITRGNILVREKMLRTFIATIPAAVGELKQAHAQADYQTLQLTAHRIKPVLRFYAMVTVENDVQDVEDLARRRNSLAEIQAKILKLDTVVNTVVQHIENDYLNN